ncbi:constitutive coactivator of peroxisome proliferator-activated receptor gamma [Trichonephila clavipes]|nr:constitutive coactivator of peroxisome proliferator-activated receptor gamma [Trichonephila clavipes]
MGVKFLTSYFEGCYGAFKKVSIKEMADRHRKIHDRQPEFEEIDVKLVFIFAGTICVSKRQAWIQSAKRKHRIVDFLFDLLLHGNEKLIQICRYHPNSLRILSRIALIELNVEIHQTNKEVDPDNFIAEYANKNDDVFAILSGDSDFIIHDTKPQLSPYHLDLSSMMTSFYDRKCFAERYLGIQVKQLPLFACLMGNDTVPFEDLEPFHKNFLGRNFFPGTKWRENSAIVVGKICDLIRFKKWTGDFTQKEELEDISEQVFHHKNKADLFRAGLKKYAIDSSVPLLSISSNIDSKFVEAINEKHYNGSLAPFTGYDMGGGSLREPYAQRQRIYLFSKDTERNE